MRERQRDIRERSDKKRRREQIIQSTLLSREERDYRERRSDIERDEERKTERYRERRRERRSGTILGLQYMVYHYTVLGHTHHALILYDGW